MNARIGSVLGGFSTKEQSTTRTDLNLWATRFVGDWVCGRLGFVDDRYAY
ncbi:hypothetical protein Q31a_35060 [Aureliella helgolandensis]|uniref:Uncharacterized protein n=1 Tax=Aureliella helgolandensis TaxID=2527968 RepID=A0A518G9D3_9BACT|nr:hypothetical protein Q31a_35060 [Aureliella helgolandensis]